MGNIIAALWNAVRWWHGPFGVIVLAAIQRGNRHNVVGLLLWAFPHCWLRLPLTRLLGRLLHWPPPVFPLRAAMFLDCTKYTIREFSMARMNQLFASVAPVACKLVPRCTVSPVVSLNAPALLGRSFWFGSADLSDSLSVILYIHGGGFCVGGARMYPVAFQALIDGALAAGVSLRILSVEYPLAARAPGHEDESCVADHPVAGYPVSADHREPDDRYGHTGFQSQIATTIAAFDYLQDELGIPAHAIVIAGDSAGGNLAIGTTLAIRDRAWRRAVTESALRSSLPSALVLFSPWTDLSASALWRHCPSLLSPAHDHYAENLDYLDPDLCQTFVEYQSANSNNWAAREWGRGNRSGWEVGRLEEPPTDSDRNAAAGAAEEWSPTSNSSSNSSSSSSRRASASAASSALALSSPELALGSGLDSVQESPPPLQSAVDSSEEPLATLEPPEHEDDGRGSPEGDEGDDEEDDDAQQPRRQRQRQQKAAFEFPEAAAAAASSSSDAVATPSSAAVGASSPSASPAVAAAAAVSSSSSSAATSSCPRIDLRYPLLSPIYADLSGLPPVRLCYGRREMLLRDILAFHSALQKAGVEVSVTTSPERAKDGSDAAGEATTHNYALFPETWGSTARRSLREIARFVSATLLQAQQKHTTTKTALARNLFSTAHFIDAQ